MKHIYIMFEFYLRFDFKSFWISLAPELPSAFSKKSCNYGMDPVVSSNPWLICKEVALYKLQIIAWCNYRIPIARMFEIVIKIFKTLCSILCFISFAWSLEHTIHKWVIPCKMDQISEKFPPDPNGFCWNFIKSMYPSTNENPENFIIFWWTVPKLQPPKLWTF